MNLKRDFWPLAGLTGVFGVFCICVPILVWKRSIPAQELIALASVILSWPVAIILVVLVFIGRFEPAIRSFLENIRSMKLPAGVEIQSQAPTSNEERAERPEGTMTLTTKQQEDLGKFLQSLAAQQQLSEAQRKEAEKLYQQALEESVDWKFQYFNQFFVLKTKQVLNWFNTNPAQSREGYDLVWNCVIPQKGERDTTFDVLSQSNMIRDDSGVINVTPEGVLFLQWLTRMRMPL